jgi:SAM-dependent methyltransferase
MSDNFSEIGANSPPGSPNHFGGPPSLGGSGGELVQRASSVQVNVGLTEYRDLARAAVLDTQSFLRATLSGQRHGETLEWVKVTLRPVEIRGERHVQFAYFDDRKCVTKNYAGVALTENLDRLLGAAYKNIHVSSVTGELQINFSKSGKPLIHRTKPVRTVETVETDHNRQKDLLLPEGKPDPYLQAIGFMTADGQIKADKQRKFRQINEFLKLLQQTGELEKFETPVIEVVDYGCGNAYLTFAVYHYLNHILGKPTRMVGIDVRAELLAKHVETARNLGWDDISFVRTTIAEFAPSAPPDITLALHACDTATDEALAQGIQTGSKLIISVPCCHHNLQEQLRRQPTPEPFRSLFSHGILAERQGDILTDSFRALILRIMGYRTDVLQFISPEHTAKNLMLRSVRSDKAAPVHLVAEYRQMKEYWGVTPYLETLLGADLDRNIL